MEDAEIHEAVGRNGPRKRPQTDGIVRDVPHEGQAGTLEDRLAVSLDAQLGMLEPQERAPNGKSVINKRDVAPPAGREEARTLGVKAGAGNQEKPPAVGSGNPARRIRGRVPGLGHALQHVQPSFHSPLDDRRQPFSVQTDLQVLRKNVRRPSRKHQDRSALGRQRVHDGVGGAVAPPDNQEIGPDCAALPRRLTQTQGPRRRRDVHLVSAAPQPPGQIVKEPAPPGPARYRVRQDVNRKPPRRADATGNRGNGGVWVQIPAHGLKGPPTCSV